MPGPEYTLAEKPVIDYLKSLGYVWLRPEANEDARDGLNNVILRDELVAAIKRINGVSDETALAVYTDLLSVTDNERWTNILRGAYSRTLPGESKHSTIWLIDFKNTANNTFTVSNQFRVEAERARIPDLVVFVNGIPLVVIEAKSPIAAKDKGGEAFDQIKLYELEIPRLFYSNLFNIITNGVSLLYGATRSPSAFWAEWRDPWPRTVADFKNKFELGLWSLLEPSRLLNVLAHFVVFEKDEKNGALIKKVCRYQQYRAVEKIAQRVLESRKTGQRKGLVWHTQGSGKSLTMAYAVLRLKLHLDIPAETLGSPNILVITDRVDLDDQITKTFIACGLPNPRQADTAASFFELVHSGTTGLTVLSTIFKLDKSNTPVADSHRWIICADEAHRTQEKNLGAFLRKTFPDAYFFGFTGTPVQSGGHDTYATFSPDGEHYLDKYGIDDAVADGATVPIHYTARKAEWHLEAEKLDIVFDNWFANEDEATRERIKREGVNVNALAKHHKRVELIAFDIWTHFKAYALPDGYKAQIVAVDREAIVLYKRALDRIIAEDFVAQGMSPADAAVHADAYSVCVYSTNQDDAKPAEDPYVQTIHDDLLKWQLGGDRTGKWAAIKTGDSSRTEAEVKAAFKKKGEPPFFLIVCAKLLTGFDAPVESVMYLDNPLKEHNLLQAIARTNRVEGPEKQVGLIVDYIGITRHLNEALATYRKEDIKGALHDLDELKAGLKHAHREVMKFIKFRIHTSKAENAEYDALIQALGSKDVWLQFKVAAKAFFKAYEALSPDPAILDYSEDMKWIVMFLGKGSIHFELKESFSLKDFSGKIREMLAQHLKVSGLATLIQLKKITDPGFFEEFKITHETPADIRDTVLRKASELKRVISERVADNAQEYGPFSERIKQLIERLESGLVDAADLLKEAEKLAEDIINEDNAHKSSGLSRNAYGILKILEAYRLGEPDTGSGGSLAVAETPHAWQPGPLQRLAMEIDSIYASEETAPIGWHMKEQLRKELRQQVRGLAFEADLDCEQVPAEVEKFALKHYIRVG